MIGTRGRRLHKGAEIACVSNPGKQFWNLDLPYRGRVLLDFSVHVRVGVHLGRGSRVEGDRGRCPAHVGHSPRRELRDLLARVRSLLRERQEDGEKSSRIEHQNK